MYSGPATRSSDSGEPLAFRAFCVSILIQRENRGVYAGEDVILLLGDLLG